MDQWTKRGEMLSIPGAAVLSEETQAWSRRACYVRRQVPGDKCGIVRLAFPVSLMCMCRRYSECTCGVGGKLCPCVETQYTLQITATTGLGPGAIFCFFVRVFDIHTYIISSWSDQSHIFSFFSIGLSAIGYCVGPDRTRQFRPSTLLRAAAGPVLPALSQATSNRKHKPSHNLNHVHNNPNLCGSQERESRRDPAVTSGCSRLHAPCS